MTGLKGRTIGLPAGPILSFNPPLHTICCTNTTYGEPQQDKPFPLSPSRTRVNPVRRWLGECNRPDLDYPQLRLRTKPGSPTFSAWVVGRGLAAALGASGLTLTLKVAQHS